MGGLGTMIARFIISEFMFPKNRIKLFLETLGTLVFLICSSSNCFANPKPKITPFGIIKDPRGPSELTICSQNLQNGGTFESSRARMPNLTRIEYDNKISAQAERIASTHCDVVALQEILGTNEIHAQESMQNLIAALKEKTGRIFDLVASPEGDTNIRNGFLVAKDRATVSQALAYSRVELPKFNSQEKPIFFERSPFEMQLEVKGREGSSSKIVTIVDFHFKSRAGSTGDTSGLQFETVRMQMAEALRRIIEGRQAKALSGAEQALVVLGDRNANFDLASAKILEGSLALKDFQVDGPCRLSKRGVPLCKTDARRPQILFSVLTSDPATSQMPGTFIYKNIYSWLDDILMPQPSLRFALTDSSKEGYYMGGVVSKPKNASDHAMVYVRLNW